MIRSLARRMARVLQPLLPGSRGGVTILTYHLVGAGTDAPVDVPDALFRQQMRELQGHCPVVSLSEALAQGLDSEQPRVVLSFDDAYENFFTHAWPVLLEHGFPALLYVPVQFVERSGPPPIPGTEHMPALSWAQMAEMCGTGLLDIGSHSLEHTDLRKLGPSALSRELQGSRDHLEDKLGRDVDSFCYPMGLWSRSVEGHVASIYRSAVIAGGGKAVATEGSFHRLQRVPIRRDMPPSLMPILQASVWLEERLASKARLVLY